MSWLSEALGSDSSPSFTPPTAEQSSNYYKQAKANNPAYYEQYLKQSDPEWQAEQAAATQAATQQAQAANVVAPPTPPPAPPAAPVGPPPYSGPSASQKLSGLLPTGFDTTLLPDTYADPFVNTAATSARGSADTLIANMLKRGGLSGTGADAARSSLGTQDATVRSKLNDIAKLKLAQERSSLRGIAGQGYTAAGAPGETGENFNPQPYLDLVNQNLGQFQQGFGTDFSGSVGDVGYDVSNLGAAGGAVQGPRNVSYDPYAVEGGKLSTGLEESGTPTPAKKRSTAVF